MKNPVYTWRGLKTIGGIKSHISISYIGKCVDGWKDFYEDLKPWQFLGYSNPIFCKSENWGYNEILREHRFIFCILWHEINIS